mgnify:CR=1 FL=1
MKEEEDYYCPCREVDPDHFITNEELEWFLEHKNQYTFTQQDYLRVYNCIHCNNCGTAEERFELKEKFLEDGGHIPGLDDTVEALKTEGTPFVQNKSRVKLPNGIPTESTTLLYLGCFAMVKTPRYAENAIKYLLKHGIHFTLLEREICCGYPILCNGEMDTYYELVKKNKALFKEREFKKIITVCPSCFMVFKKEYQSLDLEVKYFTDYLKPSTTKKSGNLIIQHACPLKNGEIPGIVEHLEDIYQKSGYNVLKSVPNKCCGGGVGHQLRTDVIEEIALDRMDDFLESYDSLQLDDSEDNFITTYCPDAYWILKVFGRKKKIPFKLRDMCALLL